jgi:hypothetical protein
MLRILYNHTTHVVLGVQGEMVSWQRTATTGLDCAFALTELRGVNLCFSKIYDTFRMLAGCLGVIFALPNFANFAVISQLRNDVSLWFKTKLANFANFAWRY